MPEVRLREILGEESEPGDQSRPAPVQRVETQDVDLQRIARLSAADEDRPGERIQAREIDGAEC